jgi:beta-glucosidase-like glycosyl hydrolase
MSPSFPPKRLFVALLLLVCVAASSALDPWRNTSLPIPDRVADLVSRLTLSEKGLLMSSTTPSIDRLGIPAFNWGTECLHGVADSILPATVFPQPIALGASFNVTLARLIGTAISDEARALYNDGNAKFLQFFAPNMNLFRDPRYALHRPSMDILHPTDVTADGAAAVKLTAKTHCSHHQ